MASLKGQNFRVFVFDSSSNKYKVVGMATNCVITQTNNTSEASHKDVVGMASMPATVSKSWQVQVDSLNVTDAAAMLTAMKNLTTFHLAWDETSTTDNQTPLTAGEMRMGDAFLSDLTLTFNNRENSAKSLTFVGSGALSTDSSGFPSATTAVNTTFTKGQFVRLFLSDDNTEAPGDVIASARQLSIHLSMTLESATTKDTDGEWEIQEPTALSYDITTSALISSGETITSGVGGKDLGNLEDIYDNGTPVKWKVANVGGDNNRTATSTIMSGSAVLTQLQINAQNRTPADYSATLNGFGAYNVGS
jgi:predicted secreted protein